MAKDDHVARLMKGATSWNAWRRGKRNIVPDLSGANLSGMNLSGTLLNRAKFTGANLTGANLSRALLSDADLSMANLSEANLVEAHFDKANLYKANLSGANLAEWTNFSEANLREANLKGANLTRARLSQAILIRAELGGAKLTDADLPMAYLGGANLKGANLTTARLWRANLAMAELDGADLSRANLQWANLTKARLSRANLKGADLRYAILVESNLTGADLTGCRIYGVSAWNLKLTSAKQQNLVITRRENEPDVTVDNIEVAQFVYLLLHNEKIRDVIDTIGKKGVLLLGRFTEGRLQTLERLREKLRSLGFVPMVFNFDKPDTKDFTETVRLLANLCHFVIVDITNPRSAPLELQATVPDYMVPFVPILENGQDPFAMFVDLQNKYDWVLEPVIVYPSIDRLIEVLEEKIVRPAEAKFNELLARRTKQLRVEIV